MDLIEPSRVFFDRQRVRHAVPAKVVDSTARVPHNGLSGGWNRPPSPMLSEKTDGVVAGAILEVVGAASGVPVRIVAVVNTVAGRGNHGTRVLRDAAKRRAFRLVGELIRSGRLRRVSRKYVVTAEA